MSLLLFVGSRRLFVDSNVFDVFDPDVMCHPDDDGMADFRATGLVEATLSGAQLLCGTHLGDVDVTAELWDGEPPLTVDEWQDVAEIRLDWKSAELEVWADDDEPIAVPIPGPGRYRLRVSATDRDVGEDRDDTDPVERVRLQLWPGDGVDVVRHKETSRTAEYWRHHVEPDPAEVEAYWRARMDTDQAVRAGDDVPTEPPACDNPPTDPIVLRINRDE